LLSNLHKRTNTVLWMHEIQRMCQKAVIRSPWSAIRYRLSTFLPVGRLIARLRMQISRGAAHRVWAGPQP